MFGTSKYCMLPVKLQSLTLKHNEHVTIVFRHHNINIPMCLES